MRLGPISRMLLACAVMYPVGAWGQVPRTPPATKADAGVESSAGVQKPEGSVSEKGKESKEKQAREFATFGSGCFWCTEAVFEQVKGVERVDSGFSGGQFPNPSYQQVLTGLTGHAEVCQLTYDPSVISFAELLEIFWKTHDPTTLNQQGPDYGTQYRSVVFYHSVEQKKEAEFYLERLNREGVFGAPVVTEVAPYVAFYPAEKYHQDYYRKNPRAEYCMAYITPKVQKLRKVFKEKLKK